MNTDQILEIKRLQNANEASICARMMARSEPWITLERDYAAALEIVNDPMREVYIGS